MKATIHSAQRFLERVLKKDNYSITEVKEICFYLNKIFKDILPRSYRGYCPFPNNPNFVIAYQEDKATTILPKEYIKDEVLYGSGKLSKKEFRKIKRG